MQLCLVAMMLVSNSIFRSSTAFMRETTATFRKRMAASSLLLHMERTATRYERTSPVSLKQNHIPYHRRIPQLRLLAQTDHHRENHLDEVMVTTRRAFVAGSALLSSIVLSQTSITTPPVARAYDEEDRRIAIFEKTSRSVVFIDTFVERRDSLTTNIMEVPLGSGSGFVWDKQGHIVTNYHVVRNAQSAQVAILLSGADAKLAAAAAKARSLITSPTTSALVAISNNNKDELSFRQTFTASIVGVDPGKDIAVLKIDADPVFLFPIAVGSSSGIKVGQQAMAIGNPFGLDHTLTSGIISGTGREVRSPIGRPITNVLQTDAAINPGNSGGPLLDSNGKLIGMNTAIFSPSGASAGIGFAIPVDQVKSIVETLIQDGRVVRPVLGISYLGSKQARTLGITSGVLVLEVPPNSPAYIAGLRGTRRTQNGLIELGDIITKVNDRVIEKEADLFGALETLKPGDIVDVTVNRVVAVSDEIQVKEVIIPIQLQPSTQFEKQFLLQPAQ